MNREFYQTAFGFEHVLPSNAYGMTFGNMSQKSGGNYIGNPPAVVLRQQQVKKYLERSAAKIAHAWEATRYVKYLKLVGKRAKKNRMNPKLDDLHIPHEIWRLADVTPAGKILLALCQHNSSILEWRLRLALDITHNGLRELQIRLARQGLLTRFNPDRPTQRRYRVNVVASTSAGHLADETTTLNIGQKVALAEGQSVYDLTVPGEILSLPNVMAGPKLILTLYARDPQASNGQITAELGISASGLKKARRQLVTDGLLVQRDGSYTPQVPGIVYTEEGGKGHFVSDIAARTNVKKLAAKPQSIEEIVVSCNRSVAEVSAQKNCAPGALEIMFAYARKQIEAEFPGWSPRKDHALAYLKGRENRFFAAQFVYGFCKVRKQRIAYFKMIGQASDEQVRRFREQAEPFLLKAGTHPNLRQLLAGA